MVLGPAQVEGSGQSHCRNWLSVLMFHLIPPKSMVGVFKISPGTVPSPWLAAEHLCCEGQELGWSPLGSCGTGLGLGLPGPTALSKVCP